MVVAVPPTMQKSCMIFQRSSLEKTIPLFNLQSKWQIWLIQ